ncbi:neutral zinc metallopeptidase [Mycobacteroides sp. LB1]|nr:neutral zinc metallopeptidase [Mycobacteroides sp. LB1]
MEPMRQYGRPRPVPGWNAPLPGPAPMPMAPPQRGWRPPQAPSFTGYPPPPMSPGYQLPPARPVYPPPAAYGYRPLPLRQPPGGRGGGGIATALIIGAVAFGLVVVTVVAVLVKRAVDVSEGGSTRTSATRAQTPSYRYPLTTSRSAASSSASTTATSRRTSTTTQWTLPPPPPPPRPKPVAALGNNPLFQGDWGFTNAPCSTSTWPFDIPHADAFYRDLRGCMDPEWRRLLDGHDLPWSSPGLVVAGNYVDSPCGDKNFGTQTAAFYCPSNDTIYMSTVGTSPSRYGNHDGIYLAVYAHEYGHHGQELSGIWSEYWNQRRRAGVDSPQGLELSRRAELQAQCFSGMFLGSRRGGTITQHELDLAWNDQDRGDGQQSKRDHGSNQHAESWWRHGSLKNRLWQCNTWLADSSEVS